MIVTAEELATIRGHAVREYPRESCGVVLVRDGARRLMACRNVQDDLHAKDPERNPRDSRTAYYIDPADLLAMGRLEADGFAVSVIYHSHVDAGAYFSETDTRNALMAGEPAYPGVTYLVTSVLHGTADTTAAFRWDPERRDFAPVALDVPAPKAEERPA